MSLSNVNMMKSRQLRRAGHVVRMGREGGKKCIGNCSGEKMMVNLPITRPRTSHKDRFIKIVCGGGRWMGQENAGFCA